MTDHQERSPQSYSSSRRHQSQYTTQPHRSNHSHQSSQSHYSSSHPYRLQQSYNQDIQGPLSAGVIEGHRAFPSFHSGFRSRAQPIPAPTSYPNLSVADILDRYQDANKEFLVSILNAKAKEDERKTEEERYKTEQVRLQSKQLELELAMEKRRGSSPSGRPFTTTPPEATNGYSTTPTTYRSTYSSYPSSTPSSATVVPPSADSHQSYGRQSQHDHPTSQDTTENPTSSSTHGSTRHHPYQDQHHMQPSPQSRPPSLKINTALRQHYPKQPSAMSSQRGPVSPQSGMSATLPPLPHGPSSSKATSRHYSLSNMSNSAHSSPVTNIDYQSHIPPPVTPKEEHISPTSTLSPAGHSLKRKSTHHDAVMDAVRAKVLRNAGQNQQREREQQQQQQHRRKSQHQGNSSPDRPKRSESNGSTMAGPKSKQGSGGVSPSRPEANRNNDNASVSPISPSTPVSATLGSGQSRSCSPPSAIVSVAAAGGDIHRSSKPTPKEGHNGYSKILATNEESRSDSGSSAEDEKAITSSRYEMNRSRAERSSEIGVLAV